MISTTAIRFVQRELKDRGRRIGKVDGKLGPKTERGLQAELKLRVAELPEGWQDWPRTRLLTAYVQLRCGDEGVNPGPVDGLWGTQTDFAFETVRQRLDNGVTMPNFRDSDELVTDAAAKWPRQTQAEVRAFFGNVGTGLVRLELPYGHKLAWDKTQRIHRYSCNAKVHDSLGRILTKVLETYGEDEIEALGLNLFGGCYNKRKKKGGSSWSMHAWAIAVDYHPEENRFRWGWDRAAFARPEYDPWWSIWEAEGWTSLGRARNFDWMHIQAAHL